MSNGILAIASAGSHWVQLRRLRQAFEGLDVAFASVYPDYAQDVQPHRFYWFPDVSRFNKLKLAPLILYDSGANFPERAAESNDRIVPGFGDARPGEDLPALQDDLDRQHRQLRTAVDIRIAEALRGRLSDAVAASRRP